MIVGMTNNLKAADQSGASAVGSDARKAYSVMETCRLLGLSHPTIYDLIQKGRLRTVMVGRRRLIPAAEIDRLLAGDAQAT